MRGAADREDLAAPEVELRARRRPANVADRDSPARGLGGEGRIVGEELVETVDDRHPRRDRLGQQAAQARRHAAARGRDADDAEVGLLGQRAQRFGDRGEDRDAAAHAVEHLARVAAGRRRVDDGDDAVALRAAHEPVRRLRVRRSRRGRRTRRSRFRPSRRIIPEWRPRGTLPDDTEDDLAERRRAGSIARAGAPAATTRPCSAPEDLHLFNEGTHLRLWERLGSHVRAVDGVAGTSFAVFAPNAASVSVVGDFNGWDATRHPLEAIGELRRSGRRSSRRRARRRLQVPDHVALARRTASTRRTPTPCARKTPPRTGSVVWDLDYRWRDDKWIAARASKQSASAPISIYEVHLGSWRRVPEEGNRPLTYREAARLARAPRARPRLHARRAAAGHGASLHGILGLPGHGLLRARPAASARPQDFMYLVDTLHQAGLGVILDWVPSHFPVGRARSRATSTARTSTSTPTGGRATTPTGRAASSTTGATRSAASCSRRRSYWLEVYHADGLRVDAVASMLHLDYSRKAGEWIPNRYGGWENLEAISLLRRLNDEVRERHPDTLMIAEESTAWPMVSRPTYVGGLGFDMKWDLGWMNDTLDYMELDPVYRKFHHNELTFRRMYQYSENFVLPLSHDEVVHLKRSLLSKMPGDDWQKFANLRLLYAYMWAQAGKKLLFMGGEFGQRARVEPRREPRLAPAREAAARGPRALGARPEPPLRGRAGAPRSRLRPARLRVDRLPRRRPQRGVARAPGPRRAGTDRRRVQLHARSALRLTSSAWTFRATGSRS